MTLSSRYPSYLGNAGRSRFSHSGQMAPSATLARVRRCRLLPQSPRDRSFPRNPSAISLSSPPKVMSTIQYVATSRMFPQLHAAGTLPLLFHRPASRYARHMCCRVRTGSRSVRRRRHLDRKNSRKCRCLRTDSHSVRRQRHFRPPRTIPAPPSPAPCAKTVPPGSM